jgi:outer membrane murein-binding lipoprotein Lpp
MNQVTIPFRGWNLIAWINSHPSDARIAVKPICEAIGLAWQSQHAKLKASPQFDCNDIVMVAEDGHMRPMTTLPVSQLNGWLFGINPNKVKPEVVQYLTQFQQYCFQALYNALSGTANADVVAELHRQMDDLIAQVSYLTQQLGEMRTEIAETKRENSFLRAQLGQRADQEVSNAARTLRNGHLKN